MDTPFERIERNLRIHDDLGVTKISENYRRRKIIGIIGILKQGTNAKKD
jgi:hypothetical protein